MTEAKTEHTLELIEAARLLKFNAATGWPQTFAHDQLAALQSWRKGMERKDWFKEAATWRELIELALASGAIEHTTTTERVQVSPQIRRIVNPGYGSSEWTERGFERGFASAQISYVQPGQSKEVTRHHITASAFAAWLAAQSMEPSPHIAAWFKAQGVGTVPAGETTQAAPMVAESASNAPVVVQSADDGEAWKAKARERAAQIIKRQREKDLYPSQTDIADEIAREFRAAGKPLTGAYIKRHALKGISSTTGRQLSTSTRRGK